MKFRIERTGRSDAWIEANIDGKWQRVAKLHLNELGKRGPSARLIEGLEAWMGRLIPNFPKEPIAKEEARLNLTHRNQAIMEQ